MWTRAVLAALFLSLAAPSAAQRLPLTAVPEHYDLAFDVQLAEARFDGVETIRVRVPAETTSIVLHALDIVFREVTVAGQTATVSTSPEMQLAHFTVDRPIPVGVHEIRIRYAGTLNDRLRGFYLSQANGRRYAVTQLESTDARRAFPSFDEPALKATFAVTVTIDRGDTAISNGRVVSDTPGPGAGRHTLTFSTTAKMSTYLVAIAVGDFQCLETSADNIPIRICATPDKKELGRFALESSREILRFLNRYHTITYPFGKLDIVAVPDFAAGAMENTAAIFFREAVLLAADGASATTRKNIAGTLAHEIAHMWFGDLVTMKWWDDLWLNEGFASWMANRPLAAWKPEWRVDVDEAIETQRALALDSLASTRAIRSPVNTPAEIEASFDGITYEKGAALIRMVERYIGAEAFRTGVNAYLEKYAYGNATSQDFWNEMAASSGKPVDRVLTSFVDQPGFPLLTVASQCAEATARTTVTQERFLIDATPDPPPLPLGWWVPVCTRSAADGVVPCAEVPQMEPLALTHVSCPSWTFVNAGAQGYFRTAYEPAALKALASEVRTKLTAPERVSLLGDEWALVQAGRHRVSDYLTLASGFRGERTSGILTELTTRLQTVHTHLTTAATRPAFEAFVRSVMRPIFDELGIAAKRDDTDETGAVRAAVISALGHTGNDREVASQARVALDAALAGRQRLDATAAGAIVGVAAAHGDRTLQDALLKAAEAAAAPEDRDRYLFALGRFTDPVLVERGLEYARTPALRSQDTGAYLYQSLNNPAINQQAWRFVKAHWAELESKIVVAFGDLTIVTALGSFCDASTRDDIRQFFAGRSLPATTRTLDQTLERITNCIALKTAQTSALTDWLADRR
jgi:aminopeptidase N